MSKGIYEIGYWRGAQKQNYNYPGKQLFDNDNSEQLLDAARATLERRLAAGGGHTGRWRNF